MSNTKDKGASVGENILALTFTGSNEAQFSQFHQQKFSKIPSLKNHQCVTISSIDLQEASTNCIGKIF